jgi:trans-4-hydroxy-L-proline dehydratase
VDSDLPVKALYSRISRVNELKPARAYVAHSDTNRLFYTSASRLAQARVLPRDRFGGVGQMPLVEVEKQSVEDRILSRVRPLIDRMYQLEKEGVRRSLREDLIRQGLDGTLSDPFPIRRAKAFCYLLDHTELVIHERETVLGSLMGLFPLREKQLTSEEIYLEGKAHILERAAKGDLSNENRKTAQLEFNYIGPRVAYQDLKAVAERISDEMGDGDDLTFTQVFSALESHFCDSPQAIAFYRLAMRTDGSLKSTPEEPLWTMAHHLASDYEKVLKLGFGGIRDEAVSRMAGTEDEAKRAFYQAVIISMEGAMGFVHRYAEAALGLSESETDPERRKELAEMARIARNIAEEPANTFREALQLFWITNLMLCIAGGISLSAGRFDQYMYPYYRDDLADGRITEEEALEYLACLRVKYNEPSIGPVQNMTVGGITPEGDNGINALTYLCLRSVGIVKMPYPNMTLRVFDGMDEELYSEIVELVKMGTGLPALWCDDVIVEALRKAGAALEDARDYIVQGCTEIMIAKKQPPWGFGHKCALPALFNRTIREFPDAPSFDALLDHFKSIVQNSMDEVAKSIKQKWDEIHRIGCDPFGSALVQGCMERGLDLYARGGPLYPGTSGIALMGLGTTADSMAAVKKLVYEEKRLTLGEFSNILERNFRGDKSFHLELLNKMPKYGNSDEYVDSIARDVAEFFCRTVLSHNEWPRRESFVPRIHSYLSHVTGGLFGATADGRLAGQPISDAASPAQGRDHLGPTATINSVTKIDYTQVAGGIGMNMKFSPHILQVPEGDQILISLIKTYFKKGGLMTSYNLVDEETLANAMKYPERHQNLIVRVAGFSEYFVKLDPKLQREILERTAHELAG